MEYYKQSETLEFWRNIHSVSSPRKKYIFHISRKNILFKFSMFHDLIKLSEKQLNIIQIYRRPWAIQVCH